MEKKDNIADRYKQFAQIQKDNANQGTGQKNNSTPPQKRPLDTSVSANKKTPTKNLDSSKKDAPQRPATRPTGKPAVKEDTRLSTTKESKDEVVKSTGRSKFNLNKYAKEFDNYDEIFQSPDFDETQVVEDEEVEELSEDFNVLDNGNEKRTHNSAMATVTMFVAGVFLMMIIYMAFFIGVQSKDVINNSYNKRSELLEETVKRGTIYGSGNEVLAETVMDADGDYVRSYPYKELFSHVVGRFEKSKTGIEKKYDFTMLTSSENQLDIILKQFNEEKLTGNSVKTTLSVKLQKAAYEALGDHRGAVVAIEPSTGKILALVSTPAYDPNTIISNWDTYNNDARGNHVLLNRATQGLYPPGSTFKIVTALEYLKENPSGYMNYSYQCKGSANFGNFILSCYNKKNHGQLDLAESFAKSCNTSFANIGTGLNLKKYGQLCDKLLFNQELPIDLACKDSSFSLTSKSEKTLVAQTAIGQGDTTMTPIHNAMLVAAIANEGTLMKPFVVEEILAWNGKAVQETKEKEITEFMTKDQAKILTNMMIQVVDEGTGSKLKGMAYQVAGKTGSAEYDENGNSHAWFVGFAPAQNPQIAISVLVEGAGTGSEAAVPVAKKVFQAYLGQ